MKLAIVQLFLVFFILLWVLVIVEAIIFKGFKNAPENTILAGIRNGVLIITVFLFFTVVFCLFC